MASVAFSSNSSIKFKWCNSIRLIDISEWEAVFGKRDSKSYNLFLAIEDANFKGVGFHYLKIYNKGHIASIVPCFDYRFDLIGFASNKKPFRFLGKMQKFSYDFFYPRMLVIGPYISNNENFIEIISDTEEDYREIRKVINLKLKSKKKEINARFVYITNIRKNEFEKIKNIFNKKFSFYRSFSNAILPIGDKSTPYPFGLKDENKQQYENSKKQFDQNFYWEVVSDFSKYAGLLEKLELKILYKFSKSYETQNSSFLTNIQKRFPDQSFLIIAKDKCGQIRVVNLLLEEKDKLFSLYYGIKSMEDDEILYRNSLYKTIEIAEERGKEYIELGGMIHELKVQSGAFLDERYAGFYTSPHWKLITKRVLKRCLPSAIPPSAYTKEAEDKAIEKLQAKGFCMH